MTDTPGRLLSSLSHADGKPPKVGGCVGVFFQLFDWNRRLSGKHLFSTKSLPAERPQSNKFNDEKLPMAKLLLIADENRGLFPRSSSSETQSEVGSERSSENGSNRKPGIVARLMGLESFPDSELQAEQSKELKPRAPLPPRQQQQAQKKSIYTRYQELQMLEDLLQGQEQELRKLASSKEMHQPSGKEAGQSKPVREDKMPKNTKKMPQDPMDKVPLSPKKSMATPFALISSPSKSNKVAPPIKSQSSRKTSILMGAAARILDQPSRSRALLDKPASEMKPSSGFHGDLKKSLPRSGRQVQKEKPEVKKGVAKASTSLFQGKLSGRAGSRSEASSKASSSLKQQVQVVKTPSKVDEEQASEHEDESQSVDCDSQASSSKENRSISVKLPPQKAAPKLSRSGSVKEEQPPTPPSRGSLFRSKSVREEAAPSPQPLQPSPQQVLVPEKTGAAPPGSKGGKEIRLKRDKRSSSPDSAQKPEPSKRKPALDQGRTSSRGGESQPKSKAKIGALDSSQQKKNGSILSYDRIFGPRKQGKSKEPEAEKPKSPRNKPEAEELEKKEGGHGEAQKSESSLMKSLLRRKPLSKAETVSSSKKKVAEKKTRSSKESSFERQRRLGGASPGREAKESPRLVPCGFFEETSEEKLGDPVPDISPEKLHGAGDSPRVHFEASDLLADRSLEEILKTILSKSLGKTSLGDSPLGKECKTPAPEENSDDPTVIDMDVSPGETEDVSRSQELDELPCKALQFEEDDQGQAATPLALPLDTCDDAKEGSGGAEDGGQPSPVSVLDFSALQSPFPSETSASCEENDAELGQEALESDGESFLACKPEESSSYRLDFSEVEAQEEAASYEGQEIDLYVRDVLRSTGFATTSEGGVEEAIPCSEEIFHRLEKQREAGAIEFSSDEQRKFEAPGSCHRLMYECIGEALNLVLEPLRDERYEAMAGLRGRRPVGEELVSEVSSYILAWREMTLGMVDELVEVDMSSAAGKWKEFGEERLEIGMDLERMIFRSVIEDLISDLIGLRLRRRLAGFETLVIL